jgi:hypothetical protein
MEDQSIENNICFNFDRKMKINYKLLYYIGLYQERIF